ncbi:UNVERIFIED_ORG: hypothetical protein M2348_004249 [Sphingomonas sp. R1F5B]
MPGRRTASAMISTPPMNSATAIDVSVMVRL